MGNIRAELRLKNETFISAIEKLKITQSELARRAQVEPAKISDIVNLKYNPVENSESELRITMALNSDYNTLFRPYESAVKFKRRGYIQNKYIASIPIDKVLAGSDPNLIVAPQLPKFNSKDFKNDFIKCCRNSGIGLRAIKIILTYYGIEETKKTLEEIGVEYRISRERVRQIISKSESMLRRGGRSDILIKYLGEIFE